MKSVCQTVPKMLDETKLVGLVKELTKNYGESHDYTHALKVAQNANVILTRMWETETITNLRNEGLNVRDVVHVAAWTHDVLDHKMIKSPEEYDTKKLKLKQFLNDTLPESEVMIVQDIIENVSFSKEKAGKKKCLGKYEVLRDIVSDSDKIEAIGKAGLIRCYKYTTETNPNLDKELVEKEMKQHCVDKLMLLYTDYIRTEPGKNIGREKHTDVVDFYNGVYDLDHILK